MKGWSHYMDYSSSTKIRNPHILATGVPLSPKFLSLLKYPKISLDGTP